MDSRKFNKYKIISEILEKAKQAGIAKIQHGNTSKDVMDAITTTIDDSLDKVYKSSKKDITLPPCECFSEYSQKNPSWLHGLQEPPLIPRGHFRYHQSRHR